MELQSRILALSILLVCMLIGVRDAAGQEDSDPRKRAQTGMKFLSVSVDARSAAMADAMTGQEGSSVSAFYNPAGMAGMTNSLQVSGGQVNWFADIKYNLFSMAYRPMDGRYGVFGFSLVNVDYPELLETIRADNEAGYIDLGGQSPSALSAGVTYAVAITDRVLVGGNAKYARQSLGSSVLEMSGGSARRQDYARSTAAFDFGILYRTGLRSMNFAMSVRNFAREVTFVEESIELPLTFRIGLSMNVIDFTNLDPSMHKFTLAVDAERPRDFYEQVRIGGEYLFMNTVALRGGYAYPTDEQGVSLGAGLKSSVMGVGFGFDYAYSQFGILGNVNRIGLAFAF